MADRELSVKVNLEAGGNLGQQVAQTTQQVAGLQKQVTQSVQAQASLSQATAANANQQVVQTKQQVANYQKELARGNVAQSGLSQAISGNATRITESLSKIQDVSRGLFYTGMGTMAGGIMSLSPQASQQVTNSFRLLGNEVALTVVPQVTRMTGVVQNAARIFRGLNQETRSAVGNVLFFGTATAGTIMGVGMLTRTLLGMGGALRTIGMLPAAGAAAGGVASGAGAGAGAAGGAGAGAAAGGAVATPWGLLTVGALSGLLETNRAVNTIRDIPRMFSSGPDAVPWWHTAASTLAMGVPGGSLVYDRAIRPAINLGRGADQQLPSTGLARTLTDAVNASPMLQQLFAPPRPMYNLDAQMMNDPAALWERTAMGILNQPAELAEQQAEGNRLLTENTAAVNGLNDTIRQTFPPQEP